MATDVLRRGRYAVNLLLTTRMLGGVCIDVIGIDEVTYGTPDYWQ